MWLVKYILEVIFCTLVVIFAMAVVLFYDLGRELLTYY